MEQIRVLLIEDNPGDARLIKAMLAKETDISFNLEWKDRLSEGLKRLAEGGIDVVLLDLMLPDSIGGFYTFNKTQAHAPGVPIVVLTAFEDEDFAIGTVQIGAQDYLIKGKFDSNMLMRTIRYAIMRKQALKNYVARFKQANHLKNLFTDIMRHDMMNLTGIIKTTAELRLEDTKDEKARNDLMLIKSTAGKLIETIKNASTYALLVESVEKLERKSLDLNEIFRRIIDRFKPDMDKKNMKLEYLAKGECYAMVNPMIEDVFSNLIGNAIKYSPEGSKIETDIIKENEYYKIYVKDWGYGIKDEDKEMLFTRFQREDVLGIRSMELGLAIVNRIAELHGGKVWVDDNPEGGSVFYVDIPKNSG